jgi:hypothetical protein
MRSRSILILAASSLLGSCTPPDSAAPLRALLHSARTLLAADGFPEPSQDPNHGGHGGAMKVTGLGWGRLADVTAPRRGSAQRELVAQDLVIGPDVESDGRDFEIETQPVTGVTEVAILHEIGSPEFEAAWARLETGLVPVDDKSADAAELPPFPKIPRDAAVVVRFDDLIDPGTVGPDSVQAWTRGTPPARVPLRVLADRNHGGWTGGANVGPRRFLPTRVVVVAPTAHGDAVLRIPTQEDDPAGHRILRNLDGRGPASGGNGSVDPESPALDLVRAVAAGADGDPFQGLLADTQRPRVVGVQPVAVGAVAPDPQGGPHDYLAILTYSVASCAHALRTRDVVAGIGWTAIATQPSPPPFGGRIARARLRLVSGGPPAAGQAEVHSAYDPVADQGHEACFVRFMPAPAQPPDRGVPAASTIRIEFSEPMDPGSISALDSWTVTTVAQPSDPHDYVAARALASVHLDAFEYTPVLPFDHVAGASETLYVNLASGSAGPRDMAGNPLQAALPSFAFHLDPSAPTDRTGSYVLRFDSADEDGNGHPEIRGQFLYDLAAGEVRPRPVQRFSAVADRTQTVPALMHALPSGVQTPLNPLGSRLHALWRYCDVGLGLLDESFTNVDVEGLDWSPIGGTVVADHFTAFEMSLAHTGHLPDEWTDPSTLLPAYPQSGVVATFSQNLLDPVEDPSRVVHPRALGYSIQPGDVFLSGTGTPMIPWPMNRTLPPDQHVFYTWRDTALQAKSASGGTGAELAIVVEANGTGTPGVPFPAGQVPTIGLPLLMEFKCFADPGASGANSLDASIAVNSSPEPNFRAFSAGGVNTSGQTIVVDPDQSPIATGGFDPSSNPPGQPTLGVENTSCVGQMDLVVRVSRVHTIWVDTGSANALYSPTVVEPGPADQPAGTRVVVAYRGATAATAGVLQGDAGRLDAYGEIGPPDSVTFLHGDPSWKNDISQLAGARFVQARISFVSNAATGRSPRLSALGLAYRNP